MKLEILACVQVESGVLSDGDKMYNVGDIVDIKNQKLADELLEKNLAKEYVKPAPEPERPKPQEEKKSEKSQESSVKDDLTKIKTVDKKLEKLLNENGINTIKGLAESNPDKIAEIPGISKARANKIIEEAAKALK